MLSKHVDASKVTTTIAVCYIVQVGLQPKLSYLHVAETIAAIVFLVGGLVKTVPLHPRLHRSTVIKLVVILLLVTIIVASMSKIRHPPQRHRHTLSIPIPTHPIQELIRNANAEFHQLISHQSHTLAEAIEVYKQRNGRLPPPKFDLWFTFAQANNVQMIDEYDTITHLLQPFWGLDPTYIRHIARDALGAEDTHFLGLLIRDGKVTKNVSDWVSDALAEMMKKFVHHLPDMDLVFNIHDEPSIVIPHDLLNSLVVIAQQKQHIPRTSQNSFSQRPSDLVDEIPQHYGTSVIRMTHQTAWTQQIRSCPLDSPVRTWQGVDDFDSFATKALGFIYNTTAASDVCKQPSLPQLHGFFDRPNTMHMSAVPIPLFSVGKPSSFNDILFPSPWYYDERTWLNESKDMTWETKINQLHWRGSTTSGYPNKGGWPRHHRQRFVSAMDQIQNPVPVLENINGVWIESLMSASTAQPLFDVKFSSVSDSSDAHDREEQRQEFDIAPREDQQDLWKWKYLLDLDGHGMSGRFYAMLKSRSLVFKCAMFREWHDEWLKPWVHYVPLSLYGNDWFEAVRYFSSDDNGKVAAEKMARESRRWSKKVLRKEDMEAWVFRLLLEYVLFNCFAKVRYARVIDDNRDIVGFQL
jgi:Glycosyl transferase family 90